MTERELKRMGRRELIEIIVTQKKQELELRGKLEKAEAELEDRTIRIANVGSIAEAALALNGVFDTAQAAAEAYLCSIRAANADAELRASQTREECRRRLEETDRQCAEKLAAVDAEIERRTGLFNDKIRDYLQTHPELQNMD